MIGIALSAPFHASAMLSSKMIRNARLEVYKGAPHGLCSTLKDRVNADPLSFIRAWVEGNLRLYGRRILPLKLVVPNCAVKSASSNLQR